MIAAKKLTDSGQDTSKTGINAVTRKELMHF
jgi:hypothetical protein